MIPANAAEAALQRLEGTVNSFVRRRGATMLNVEDQYRVAVHFGVTKEELSACVSRGASSPPNADPERVDEIKRRFLQ